MKTIKFNKRYTKLYTTSDISIADLIQIIIIDRDSLSERFIRYDTRHVDCDDRETYIDLKEKNYLMLFFETIGGQVYTTLRKNNAENVQFYANSVGESFRIVIEVENEKE